MAILHVCLLLCASVFAELYDFKESSIYILNTNNFDKQVTNKRDKYVSIVHFYRHTDNRSTEIANNIKQLSNDWQGVYVIGVVDCDKFESLCEREGVSQTPVVKVYPPYPAPVLTYDG